MPILNPQRDPVPFDELAAILSYAIAQSAGGGPLFAVLASGRDLAAAVHAKGFRVVRDAVSGQRLTL